MRSAIFPIVILLVLFSSGCKKEGCTSSCAENYDEKAKVDDGKCSGCTDSQAVNYCSGASIDNGSCQYDDVSLTVELVHNVGSTVVDYDTLIYTSNAGNSYSIELLKYFISDIRFHSSTGSDVLIDEIHYVDARETSTTTIVPTTKVKKGSYTHVSFVFGIDENKNTTGLFSNPPEVLMEWPVLMGGGYHMMKLEGRHDSSGVLKSYRAHLGSLNGAPRHVEVTIPNLAFAVENNLILTLNMDINKWFETPNTFDMNDIESIMGDSTKQAQLSQNGADVFSATIQ